MKKCFKTTEAFVPTETREYYGNHRVNISLFTVSRL